MSSTDAHNPICKCCKREELTDEEALMGRQTGYQCYYCIAFLSLKIDNPMPDQSKYGRSGITKEMVLTHNSTTFAPPPSDKSSEVVTPPTVSDDMKLALEAAGITSQQLTPNQVSEITVHGANEQTYLKFSVPGQVPSQIAPEFERLMKEMLQLFGSTLAFGINFVNTLNQLKKINIDMFGQSK